jgi:hypothetical protein
MSLYSQSAIHLHLANVSRKEIGENLLLNSAGSVPNRAPARVHYEDVRISCQRHFQSVQNLWYLASLEPEKPQHVKFHLHIMGRHLDRLSQALREAL